MGYKNCCVKLCKNNTFNSFATFFKPSSNELKAKWLESYTGEVIEQKLFYICSDHFQPEDLIVNSLSSRRLKSKYVLPSIWPTENT